MTQEIDKTAQTSFDDVSDIKEFMDEYDSAHKHTYLNYVVTTNKRDGSTVEGKVSMDTETKFGIENFPNKKEDVGHHLALALDDTDNIAWYEKLARERRGDFLKNSLRITLEANKEGKVKLNKAKYFAGVIKYRTESQQRLEAYKERVRKRQQQNNNFTNSPP